MIVLLTLLCGITIEGPARVDAGELAVFTVTEPGGKWVIIPEELANRFVAVRLVDGREALVFASRQSVRVTILYIRCSEHGVEIARREFVNGGEPQPEPKPSPRPTPPFVILWIEESTERTPQQAAAQNDAAIRRAIAQAGWTLRVVDKDVCNEDGVTPPDLKPWIEDAIKHGLPQLYVVDKSGRFLRYQAPKDKQEFINILQGVGLPINVSARRFTSPAYEVPVIVPSGVCVGPYCVVP